MVKHGWIDSNATCLAIGNDKAVRWGAPFEVSDQSTVKIATQTQTDSEKDTKFEAQYQHLYNTAARSVMFLQQLNETFVEVLPAPVLNEVSYLNTTVPMLTSVLLTHMYSSITAS